MKGNLTKFLKGPIKTITLYCYFLTIALYSFNSNKKNKDILHPVKIELQILLTRKPEELSRRQRKRHTKLLSRKDEFSGGSCSGLYITTLPQLCRPNNR